MHIGHELVHQTCSLEFPEVAEIDGSVDVRPELGHGRAIGPPPSLDGLEYQAGRQGDQADANVRVLLPEPGDDLVHGEELVAREPEHQVGAGHLGQRRLALGDVTVGPVQLDIGVLAGRNRHELTPRPGEERVGPRHPGQRPGEADAYREDEKGPHS